MGDGDGKRKTRTKAGRVKEVRGFDKGSVHGVDSCPPSSLLPPLPTLTCISSDGEERIYPIRLSAFLFFPLDLGGVTCRPRLLYGYFAFFSAGFKICAVVSPLDETRKGNRDSPGRNTIVSHPRTSSHRHCQTLHNN